MKYSDYTPHLITVTNRYVEVVGSSTRPLLCQTEGEASSAAVIYLRYLRHLRRTTAAVKVIHQHLDTGTPTIATAIHGAWHHRSQTSQGRGPLTLLAAVSASCQIICCVGDRLVFVLTVHAMETCHPRDRTWIMEDEAEAETPAAWSTSWSTGCSHVCEIPYACGFSMSRVFLRAVCVCCSQWACFAAKNQSAWAGHEFNHDLRAMCVWRLEGGLTVWTCRNKRSAVSYSRWQREGRDQYRG